MKIWKPVVGYENCYEVSNDGEVKSLLRKQIGINRVTKEKILKLSNVNGYKYVGLKKDGISKMEIVHRLVAMAFIPNLQNKPFINHLDGNKTNNNVNNLAWSTNKENQLHSYRVLGTKGIKKCNMDKTSKPVVQIDIKTNKEIKKWNSIVEAKTSLGIKGISKVCKGKMKQSGGYKWKYIQDLIDANLVEVVE